MGLLEKAESGKTPKETTKKKTPAKASAKAVAKTPAKASAKIEKPKRESRFSRRREKKESKPKPEPSELPSFPDGFEAPTSGQMAFRRFVDVLVGYGWMFPVVGVFAWGLNFDATYIIIGGMPVSYTHLTLPTKA